MLEEWKTVGRRPAKGSPTHFLAEEGHNGEDGSAVKGRRGKLVEMLKEEMFRVHIQQKQLNERLRKIDGLIQKL